ncbi:MAG: hypothetical protein Q9200_007465 [Gallowayella weberi]
MSLKRHLCRFASAPTSDHIWISDDFLHQALHRYVQLRVGHRHGSAAPGPLEARKRAAKRRMMGLAPTASSPQLHPGFPAVLGRGQDNQQGWQWQSPKVAQPKDSPYLKKKNNEQSYPLDAEQPDNSSLPAWLANFDPSDKGSSTEELQIPVPTKSVDSVNVPAKASPQLQYETQDHPSPAAQLENSTDLDDMRRVIGSIQEHNQLRDACSRQALRQLLDSGCGFDKILQFWADPVMNPCAARNLPIVVAHCVELSKVDEIRRFCAWTARQFYVGSYPDSNLYLLLTELSKLKEHEEWQTIAVEFYQSIVQALQSSPVLRVGDLEPRTYSNLLANLFDDIYATSMLDLGMILVKNSSSFQLRHLTEMISPIIERWMYTWDPSRNAESSLVALSLKVASLLHAIPKNELLEVVRAISWRILDHPLSGEDLRILSQRHSLWWSAVQSPSIFQYIKKSEHWPEIAKAIRKRQEAEIESMALLEINERLSQNDIKAAYRAFVRHPLMTLEQCPHLAEALILDPNQNWSTSLMLRESRQATVLAKLQSMSDDYAIEELQHDRVRLLERMAQAYGQQEHIPAAMVFYYAYSCWSTLEQDGLGPISPRMIRALTLCGIVKPLQARRQVSLLRLEWILRTVAEVEGVATSRKLGAAIYEWLNDGYRESRHGRVKALQQSLSERQQEQDARVQENGVWDGLAIETPTQQSGPPCPKRSMKSASRTEPVSGLYSTPLPHGEGWESELGHTESVLSEPPFEQASEDFLEHEGEFDQIQRGEEPFLSALDSGIPAFVQPIELSPMSTLSPAAKHYHESTESHPRPSPITKLEFVQEFTSRDVAWNHYVRRHAHRARHASVDPQPDAAAAAAAEIATKEASSGFQSRYVYDRDTREEAIERHVKDGRTHALHTRLNAAPLVGSDEFNTSILPPSKIDMRELSSVETRSPETAVLNPRRLGKVVKASLKGKRPLGLQARKLATPKHGMKEYQGPTTLSNCREPALGPGLLRLGWLLEAVDRGERHLDLGSIRREPEEPQMGRNGIVDGKAWWEKDD